MGRESQVRTLAPNLTLLALKMPPKSPKLVFLVYICPKGYIPLTDFYQIWHGEGLPGPHGRANFHHCGIKIVALRPPKSPKIAIFGIHLAPRKKGSIEKLEYRCTRNLFCFENYTASWRFRYHKLRIRSSKAWHKKNKLEINMHHLRGNAIPTGPLSDEIWVVDGFLSLPLS